MHIELDPDTHSLNNGRPTGLLKALSRQIDSRIELVNSSPRTAGPTGAKPAAAQTPCSAGEMPRDAVTRGIHWNHRGEGGVGAMATAGTPSRRTANPRPNQSETHTMPWCHRSRKSTTGGEAKFAGGLIDTGERQVSRSMPSGRMLKAALGNAL